MSNPVCAELLIELLTPNLEDIIPETGFDNDIPKATFVPDIFVAVFTVPVDFLLDVFFVEATVTFGVSTFSGSEYKVETASSTLSITFNSVSYFSEIVMLSMFALFFSFN